MAGIERWASYLPSGSSGGRRVAGPDEDAFTLAATAVERLVAGIEPEPGPDRIDLIGEFPEIAKWGLGAVIGRAAEGIPQAGRAAAFWDAVERALLTTPAGHRSLVVAVELPERARAGDASGGSTLGAGAVAVLIDGSGTTAPGSTAPGRREGSVLDAVRETYRSAATKAPNAWVGDFVLTPDGGHPVDLARVLAASDPPLGAVSEGAYVPRPRYLENLPSRWRFVAEECGACGARSFPARGICLRCGARGALRPIPLPTDGGIVVAETTIGKGGQPTEFDAQVAAFGGYSVVLAELAPGARVTLQVTDASPGSLPIGSRIGTRLRRLYPQEGEWRYGRKAVPLGTPPTGRGA